MKRERKRRKTGRIVTVEKATKEEEKNRRKKGGILKGRA